MGTTIKYVLVFLISTFISSAALAQTSNIENPQNDPRYKDPGTSQILGIIIVGGGHFYAGETGTGAILLGSAILGPVIGASVATSNTSNAVQSGNAGSVTGPLYAGLAVSLGAWIYSIVDSRKAARRTNKENNLSVSSNIQLTPGMLTTKSKQYGYGAKLKINF